MAYDTVIFDLDGTLLNTLEDLTDSVNFVLLKRGFPARSQGEVRRFVGNGVERLIRLAVPQETGERIIQDCVSEFRQHYSENLRKKTAPYAGVMALLARLKEENYKLAIVSNKFDAAVKALCRDYFGELIPAFGESAETARKPAPDSVLKALRTLGSARETAVYVGDSEVDADTAGNAGLLFVGVTWGFRDREALERKGADYIINKPEELLEIIG